MLKRILCIPLLLLLVMPMSGMANTAEQTTKTETSDPSELVERRTGNAKAFQQDDGTIVWKIYSGDIHYYDESVNEYRDIDLSVTSDVNSNRKAEGYKYKNSANSWQVYFADDREESPMVRIESGGRALGFSYVSQGGTDSVEAETEAAEGTYYSSALQDERNYVLYAGVDDGVDLLYRIGTGSVKEEIVLREPTEQNEFTFLLTLDGVKPVRQDDGWAFADEENEIQFSTAALYMMDANGNQSDEIRCEMTQISDGQWEVKIIADPEFLSDPDTVYPVIIDPTYTVTGPSDTYDTFVSSKYPNDNYYLLTTVRTGYDNDYNKRYTYIKFNLPGGISSGSISSAKLKMRLNSYDASMSQYWANTCAFRVIENWQSSTITWNDDIDYTTTYYSDKPMVIDNWHIMTVTDIVKRWYSGTYSNYGFCVRKVDNPLNPTYDTTDPADWWTFYSSDYTTYTSRRPYLEIITGDINLDLIIPCDGAARTFLGADWQSDLGAYLEEADNALYSQFGIDFVGKTYYSWSSPTCNHIADWFGCCGGCTCNIQTCPDCCSGCRSNGFCYFCDCECVAGDWGDICRYLCNAANLGEKGILKDVLQDCGLQGKDLMTAFVRNQMYYVDDLSYIMPCDGVGLRKYAYSIIDIDEFPIIDRPAAILHEVGHALGCTHCTGSCVMNFNLQTRQFARRDQFCSNCQQIINQYK